MTTIALDGTHIAADYQVGDDYPGYRKIHRLRSGRWKGGWAAISGSFYSAMALLAEIQKDEPERRDDDDEEETCLLVVLPGGKKSFTITWEMAAVPNPPGPYAMGSGGWPAMAAMICGSDARRAVEIACRMDPNSSLCGRRRPQVVRVDGH